MRIVNRRILNLVTKPFLNKMSINSIAKIGSIEFAPFKLLPQGQNKMYFSTAKPAQGEQVEIENDIEIEQSNLSTHIKNTLTVKILEQKGIRSLFPIQIQTFQAVYQGRDLLASDRTGSGKTIAYSLPIIQKLRDKKVFKTGKKQVKFLVMCPTRQLAIQVFKEISTLKHGSGDFNVVAVYGGASIDEQIRQLRNGIDIIVATPGRLMDLIERKCINFTELQATCIDQADQMLQKGFKLDIEEIFKIIQTQRQQKTQNLMFSATIPEWVDRISNEYMDKSKKKINLISKSQTQTSTTVQHLAVECSFKDRLNCIHSLIKMFNQNQQLSTIIFAQTKLQVTDIAMEFGKNAAFLQGDMDQKERDFNLNAFRNGKRKILIATDVASRGLDIDNVGLVIQLQPPRNTQPFIHRAGRTGRAGKKGVCVTLFDKRKNLQSMVRIENQAKITFKHLSRPRLQQSQQVWSKKLNKLPQTLKEIGNNCLTNQKIDAMAQGLLSSHSDVKQLIKRQLIAIAGQPPINHSLTTEQAGFKTFTIGMKTPSQTKINTLIILNYIKSNFEALKVTNVHVQSSNVIFDVPENNLLEFKQILGSYVVTESAYLVKEATVQDREMMSLRQMAKGSRSMGGNRQYERTDNRRMNPRDGNNRFESRSQRGNDLNNADSDKLDVFIPSLPFELEKEDLEQQLRDMKVQFDSLRLIKKSETNVFAFVTFSDSFSMRFLVKNGVTINGNRCRAFVSQNRDNNKQGRPGQFGGRDRGSFNRGPRQDRGHRQDKGDNYFDRRKFQ